MMHQKYKKIILGDKYKKYKEKLIMRLNAYRNNFYGVHVKRILLYHQTRKNTYKHLFYLSHFLFVYLVCKSVFKFSKETDAHNCNGDRDLQDHSSIFFKINTRNDIIYDYIIEKLIFIRQLVRQVTNCYSSDLYTKKFTHLGAMN